MGNFLSAPNRIWSTNSVANLYTQLADTAVRDVESSIGINKILVDALATHLCDRRPNRVSLCLGVVILEPTTGPTEYYLATQSQNLPRENSIKSTMDLALYLVCCHNKEACCLWFDLHAS
jgi:hypothetical protein